MWNDLHFGWRTLRRSPGFAALAMVSLALGIGANTSIFSLLYQVVLRSVPVKDPQTLVKLDSDDTSFGYTRRDNNRTMFSYPMYRELRDRNQVFSGLIARVSFPATLAWRGNAEHAAAEVVSGNFFSVLGVKPALGRLLEPADDGAPEQNPVVVLSYEYWSGKLGGDSNAVNQQILLNNHPVSIAGVAPRGFRSLLTGRNPDFFAPLSLMKTVAPDWERIERVDAYFLTVFGRLRPGLSRQHAAAMLLPVYRAILQDELPAMGDLDADARRKILVKPILLNPAAQGLNMLQDQWETPLVVLSVMVGMVLLIACANVAGLLIARASARRREIAVRLALGATGWQLARQLLAESLLLSMAGGLLGLVLSLSLTDGLLSLLPTDTTGGWLAAQLDLRVLGYSAALSLITGVLFGLAPALQTRRVDLAPVLKEQGAGSTSGLGRLRTRSLLVGAQISVSLLLLIGAGLFTRSLVNLLHQDPGFRADHLITFSVDPSFSGYTRAQSRAAFQRVQDALRAMPGAVSTAQAEIAPFGGWSMGTGVMPPGHHDPRVRYVSCGESIVGPGYFRTLGIPLLAGRDFSEADTESAPPVVIANETLARYMFGTGNPIGGRIHLGQNDQSLEVVGVVRDSRFGDVREKPSRFLYLPYEQAGDEFARHATFLVRTSGDVRVMMAAVRKSVTQVDRNLPVDGLASMQTMIDDSIHTERLIATLAVAFGVLATLLAAVGVYGTISYAVTRRTREFGIRLALGANPKRLLLSVMREVGWLVALGGAAGLPVSYWLARKVESQFFGVHAFDPLVLAGATVAVVAAACGAALLPALRATRIEAIRALRFE